MASTSGRRDRARDDPSLSEILYVLQRRRLLIVGVVLVLAGIALLFGLFREPVYTAEARVSVRPQEKLDGEEAKLAFLEEVRGAVVTQEMLGEVRRRAGWEAGPKAFSERLDPRTVVDAGSGPGLEIRFRGDEPGQAALAANAYAELFVEGVENLGDRPLADGVPVAEAVVEQKALPGDYSPQAPDLRGHRRRGRLADWGRRRFDTRGAGQRLAGRTRRRIDAEGARAGNHTGLLFEENRGLT